MDNEVIVSQPINELIGNFSFPLAIAVFVIIQPLFEELGFRAWHSKKVSIKLLAMCIQATFLYFAGVPIWLLSLVYPLLAFCIFYKPNRCRRILTVLVTSVVFALLHWNNYTTWLLQVAAALVIFGLALVLNYLTWRFSIWWAIGLHCLNNLVAVFFMNETIESVQTDTFTISYQQSWKCNSSKSSASWTKDTIVYCGLVSNFVEPFIGKYLADTNYIYQYFNTISNQRIDVHISVSDTSRGNYFKVLSTILQQKMISLDTIIVPIYYLNPHGDDTLDLAKNLGLDEYYIHNLSLFKANMSRNFGLVLVPTPEDSSVLIKFPLVESDFRSGNREGIIAYFQSQGYPLVEDTLRFKSIISLVNEK